MGRTFSVDPVALVQPALRRQLAELSHRVVVAPPTVSVTTQTEEEVVFFDSVLPIIETTKVLQDEIARSKAVFQRQIDQLSHEKDELLAAVAKEREKAGQLAKDVRAMSNLIM